VHTISFTASSAHLREGEEQDNWRSGAAGSAVGGISCRFPHPHGSLQHHLQRPVPPHPLDGGQIWREGADGDRTDDGAPSSFILSSLSAIGGGLVPSWSSKSSRCWEEPRGKEELSRRCWVGATAVCGLGWKGSANGAAGEERAGQERRRSVSWRCSGDLRKKEHRGRNYRE
jgi:hypothetical protein